MTAATAVDHSYAYVGPDLQDTYGIDPSTFTGATTLRDSYFVGGTAAQTMARLRSTPDGILVSQETITDYQLKMGDLLRLRVLDHATGNFVVAPFHVVGVVLEFPSAPKDSFMVTNLPYLLSVTHDPGPNTVFAAASGDPTAVAARVAQATAADGTTVKDITSQLAATVSSITTVDLTGISRIEEVFVVVLAGAAMALFVTLAMGERRREFAVMAAVSATRREIARLRLERGGPDPRRRHRARRRSWLAALGASGGDAEARLRPAAGRARRAVAVPGSAGRCGRSRRRRVHGARRPGLEAHAPRLHTPGAMSTANILILEDDIQMRSLLVRGLREEDYRAEGRRERRGATGLGPGAAPDAFIIDIGLPDADGRDVVQALRAQGIGRRFSS